MAGEQSQAHWLLKLLFLTQRSGALDVPLLLRFLSHAAIFQSMTRNELLDLYFMDSRAKLLDLAAFLDRVDRGTGEPDFRLAAFREALQELGRGSADRAKAVLLSFSDPTSEPIAKAPGKGAVGAYLAGSKS